VSVRSFQVDAGEAGERLDRLAARRLGVSRSAVQRLIGNGRLLVEDAKAAPSYRVRGGELVEARLPKKG
jgi:23S rRNA-/tRNA-specific pseudouridylate synthase